MMSERVTFDNDNGETLAGVIDFPVSAPRAYALFAHCFTCTKNLRAARAVGAELARAGVATLRFDFTGLGQSGGEFAATTFSSNVADLIAAANYLEREYHAPEILIGHSLGGTAMLEAAKSIDSAVAVATIGSPSDPAHVAHLFSGKRDEILESGEAEVQLAGRPFRIRKSFLDDIEASGLPASVRSLRKALLIFHAPLDDIVEIDNASELFRHALHPKSFVSLDGADHLLSREDDAHYVGRVLAGWASRYLPQPSDSREKTGRVLARTPIGGFRTEIDADHHPLIADEPLNIPGGTDEGPSPYDLLSAALASCTSMTLRMYAERKKLKLREVGVEVRHEKIHARDCEACESTDGRIDQFRRTVSWDGELDEATAKRFLEIADMCPVHRTLEGEIEILTERAKTL